MFDQETLLMIKKTVLGQLNAEKPIVVMNDFVDGATVDVAIGLSKARLAM